MIVCGEQHVTDAVDSLVVLNPHYCNMWVDVFLFFLALLIYVFYHTVSNNSRGDKHMRTQCAVHVEVILGNRSKVICIQTEDITSRHITQSDGVVCERMSVAFWPLETLFWPISKQEIINATNNKTIWTNSSSLLCFGLSTLWRLRVCVCVIERERHRQGDSSSSLESSLCDQEASLSQH